jgi:HEPN domain-containing protein
MEYEQHLRKAIDDMKAAENHLLESGFSPDQWLSIKQYIQASIFRFQLLYGHALQEISAGES